MNASVQTVPLFDLNNTAELADQLGTARAELDQAKAKVQFFEELLKNSEGNTFQGSLFRVTVSRNVITKRVNWKKVAEHFKPSRQLLAAHTSESVSDRIRVSAMKK